MALIKSTTQTQRPAVVFATFSGGIAGPDGNTWRLIADQAWDATDPLVEFHPEAFSDTPALLHHTRVGRPEGVLGYGD